MTDGGKGRGGAGPTLGLEVPPGGRRHVRKRGHAAPPGGGPAGESCGTCLHVGGGQWRKCGLVKNASRTRNGDVLMSDPACAFWESRGLRGG